jgi:uncharacterized protein (TIGR02001 family)
MKFFKPLTTASLLVTTALASSTAMAELSFNIGVASDYVWRGTTQTNGQALVSGGVDFASESGLYIGAWTGNTALAGKSAGTTSEVDIYLGYSGELKGIGYDVGYLAYNYPNNDTLDFSEIYLGMSYDMFSAKYSNDSDNNNVYVEAAADFTITKEIGLGLHYGSYNLDTGTDYTDVSISVSKGDFSFTLSDTNLSAGADQDMKYVVSWSQSF